MAEENRFRVTMETPPDLVIVKEGEPQPALAGKLGMIAPSPRKLMSQLQFRDYVTATLPKAPPDTTGVGGDPRPYRERYSDNQMLANDQLGNCVMAERGHAINSWAGVSGNPAKVTRQEVVANYFRLTGGADTGLVIIDALNDWKSRAFAGTKIAGFVSINPTDIEAIKLAIWMFGGVCCGVNLPNAWQGQSTWAGPPGGRLPRVGPWAAGSWGGHCIRAFDFNNDQFYVRSWASKIEVPWAALPYFSEFYAVLDELWVSLLTEEAASGFNWEALNNDLPSVGA
jgi:hypothetical protein